MAEYKVGIRIDGDAAGAVAAAKQTEAATQGLAAGMGQVTAAAKVMGDATDAGAAKASTAVVGLSEQQKKMAASTKNASFQNQQLGYQLNDFFVQVSSGQSPLTALIQQGSQLSGTFGGIGNATRAVLGLLTPTVLGFGALAGAAGAVGLAIYQGASETREFNKSLVLTGGYAGVTAGQLSDMADRVSSSIGTTVGGARETLSALVASGKFAGAALEPVAGAIEKITALTGQAREDVIKNFSAMASGGVVKFAEEANKSYHFLDLAQYRYIAQLEAQGRSTEAMRFASDALNSKLGSLTQNLGALEGGWNGIKGAASRAWDAMLGVGRAQTIEQQISIAQSRADAFSGGPKDPTSEARRAARGQGGESEVETLKRTAALQIKIADNKAQQAQLDERKIAAEKSFNKVLEDGLSKSEQKARAVKKLREDAELTGQSKGNLAKAEKGLDEKYKEKGAGGDQGAKIKALAEADYNVRRTSLEKIAGMERGALDAQQRANEQAYKLGITNVRDYYDEKTRLELAQVAVQERLVAAELAQAAVTKAKVTRPEDKLNAQAKINTLETQLQELQSRKAGVQTDNASARALSLKAELDTLEKQLNDQEVRARKAVFDQQIASQQRVQQNGINAIKDPQLRDTAQLNQRMDAQRKIINEATGLSNEDRLSAERQLQEELASENLLLSEKYKPGYQLLIEEWSNTGKLMKDGYDKSVGNMLKAGEDAFVKSSGNIMDTGRAMLKQLEQDLLRLAYQNLMGQILGGSGGGGGGGGYSWVGALVGLFSSFSGGGHTGNGARSGGLDGQGGFLAMMHPQESVIDHTQQSGGGVAGGGVVLNIINNTGQQFEAQQQQGVDGKSIDLILQLARDAVAGDIASGGQVSGALQQRFGLRQVVG